MRCSVKDLTRSIIPRFYKVGINDLEDVSDEEVLTVKAFTKNKVGKFYINIKVWEKDKIVSVYYRSSNNPNVIKLVA